ncbi:TBC1 domain family member 20 [Yarrowia sp. B02]|nr:TBC1 domain family member 20 [Yarrowia sp. B02]
MDFTSVTESWVDGQIGASVYDYGDNEPLTEDLRSSKQKAIEAAYHLGDLSLLKILAQSKGGLLNSSLRRQAWPLLLSEASVTESEFPEDPHPDEAQVQLDIDRSFVFYPKFEDDEQCAKARKELSKIVVTVLRRNPQLRYYQGYHDVAQVVYLVMEDVSKSIQVLEKISLIYLRDFMLPSMGYTLDHLEFIPSLVTELDSHTGEQIKEVRPVYGISSVLTWFAHDIPDFNTVCLLFDFILASGTMATPLFIYASLTSLRSDELNSLDPEDTDILNCVLSTFPKTEQQTVAQCIQKAQKLASKTTLENYPAWHKLSNYSVLKTTAAQSPQAESPSESILSSNSMSSSATAPSLISSYLSLQIKESEVREENERQARQKLIDQREQNKLSKKHPSSSISIRRLFFFSLCIGLTSVIVAMFISPKDSRSYLTRHFEAGIQGSLQLLHRIATGQHSF